MKSQIVIALIAAFAVSMLSIGCEGDGGSGQSFPDTGGGSGLPDSTQTDTSEADTAGDGGNEEGGEAGCDGPGGCYSCASTNNQQIINACTNFECAPFDNEARLPLLNPDGSLPPLP